jgi:hypothetical protein
MKIIKMPDGEKAPVESDCISIVELADGRFSLNGSALLVCGDTEQTESVAMIGSDTYASYDDAEAAGMAWASDHCVDTLYITNVQ